MVLTMLIIMFESISQVLGDWLVQVQVQVPRSRSWDWSRCMFASLKDSWECQMLCTQSGWQMASIFQQHVKLTLCFFCLSPTPSTPYTLDIAQST